MRMAQRMGSILQDANFEDSLNAVSLQLQLSCIPLSTAYVAWQAASDTT